MNIPRQLSVAELTKVEENSLGKLIARRTADRSLLAAGCSIEGETRQELVEKGEG